MKARHFLIPFAVLGFLSPFGQAARSDHVPQFLIDSLFYEFEKTFCLKDPECEYPFFEDDSEYVSCMKSELNGNYTRKQVEAILRFKNQYGYISNADLEDYGGLTMLVAIFC